MKPTLPEWVKPGAIAFQGTTLFTITKVQRSPAGEMVLVDSAGTRYPLNACHRATISDLKTAAVFICEGQTLTLLPTRAPDLFDLSDGQQSAYVRIPQDALDFEQSVRSFARAFDGVIVTEEVAHA